MHGGERFHYKARFYHPKLGRFLQTDPIGYKDNMNLYAYVYNDPMNVTDPSGKIGWVGNFNSSSGGCENSNASDCSEFIQRIPEEADSGNNSDITLTGEAAQMFVNDMKNAQDFFMLASRGGKQNISAGEFNRNSKPKAVEEAMKDAKKNGKTEHYRALKGLLKVIKRGGRGVGPIVPMSPEMMEQLMPPSDVTLPSSADFDLTTEEGLEGCYAARMCV